MDKVAKMIVLLKKWSQAWGKKLNEFELEAMAEGLSSKYDVSNVEEALKKMYLDPDRGEFFPRASTIVAAIDGKVGDSAIIAWSKLLDGVRKVGTYRSVVFDDPAIHAAVRDMGGWTAIGAMDEREQQFHQKRFSDIYKTMRQAGDYEYPKQLSGREELENSNKGYRSEPAVLFGNPKLCQMVLSGERSAKFASIPLSEKTKPQTHNLLGGKND